MKLTNYQIFSLAHESYGLFEKDDVYIPAKANFLIQKNLRTITAAGEEIERARLKIAAHYGSLNEEKDQYIVPPDKIEDANKEINELFEIEQELDLPTIHLDDLQNVDLTAKQMQVLMFMIEE